VRAAQNDPQAQFGGKGHNLLRLFSQQVPIISLEVRKVRANVAAEGTFGKMHYVSPGLFRLAQKLTDFPRVSLY